MDKRSILDGYVELSWNMTNLRATLFSFQMMWTGYLVSEARTCEFWSRAFFLFNIVGNRAKRVNHGSDNSDKRCLRNTMWNHESSRKFWRSSECFGDFLVKCQTSLILSAVSQKYVRFPIKNPESSRFSWFLPKQALLELSLPIVTCFLVNQFVKFCSNDRLTRHSVEIPRLCTVIAIATCRIYFSNQAFN